MVQLGINLNPNAPSGQPDDAKTLQGTTWARYVFRADAERRSLEESLPVYEALIKRYNAVGVRSLIIVNQETFWGNAPWDNGDWTTYARNFSAAVGKIAARYKGLNVAYEIWNEGDIRGGSSVFVPVAEFARVLTMTSREIKAHDPSATVVFGGLAAAAGDAVAYVKGVREASGGKLPVDAVGVHPYGQWSPNFSTKPEWGGWFGRLDDHLNTVVRGIPDAPIWLTEIGVSEHVPFPEDQFGMVTTYMRGAFDLLQARFATRIPVMIWFAWGDIMRNAGIVDGANRPKQVIFDTFFKIAKDALKSEEKKDEALLTPYDGMIGVVYIDGRTVKETTIEAILARLVDSKIGAIFVKTNNGAAWQGVNDSSGKDDLRIDGLDDVQRWIAKCDEAGIEFHAWSVVRGVNPDVEIKLIADVCNLPGVKSFILDVEVGASYYLGGATVAQIMGDQLRLRIPDGFHLALCLDARGNHPRDISISRWLPNIDSLHPMVYHQVFGITPEQAVVDALTALEPFGLPVIPMLQAYDLTDANEIKRAGEHALNKAPTRNKALGISIYPYGRMGEKELAAVNAITVPTLRTRQKKGITPTPADFTNQDMINAFAAAAKAFGEPQNFWTWVTSANLAHMANDRTRPYSGLAVDNLPGLSLDQKSLIKRALAGESLEGLTPVQERDRYLGKVTNQQVINAFFEAARSAGNRDDFFLWIQQSGLAAIADNRQGTYSNPPISTLANLKEEWRTTIINLLIAEAERNPVTGDTKRLNVPYVSQIDERGLGNNDCGQASVLMLLKYYGMAGSLTVKDLHNQTPGKTSAEQLVALAKRNALATLKVDRTLPNVDTFRAILDNGRPIILLVDYKKLMFPVHLASGVDQGLHWFVLIGYTKTGFIVHDPLWAKIARNGKGGADLDITRETLRGALGLIAGKINTVY